MNWGLIIFGGIVAWLLVFGILGSWVATQCGRKSDEGFLLGALFGPLGIVVEALLPKFPLEEQARDPRAHPSDVRRSLAEVEEWHKNH